MIIHVITYPLHYQFATYRPNDMKIMTSGHDFKSECTTSENVLISAPKCLRTVVFCTQEFIDNDLHDFNSAVSIVLKEVRVVYYRIKITMFIVIFASFLVRLTRSSYTFSVSVN